MKPANLKFCPRCGSIGYQFRERKYWYCPVCLFTYYHNVAASASVVLEIDGKILLLERARDPGAGMLSLPGGFIDPDEGAEAAAIRECREETGLVPVDLRYIGSWPNEYSYKDVSYKTCDLYFSAKVSGPLDARAMDPSEVLGFRLVLPENVASSPIAFDSHRKAILAWLAARGEWEN